MTTIFEKQTKFAELSAKLILKAFELGYEVTLGEAWRPDVVAQAYATDGRGIKNSLHRLRLAIDINLFHGGKHLNKSEEYRILGEWWEAQSTKDSLILCCWGGRFGDGNHFSIEHGGVK